MRANYKMSKTVFKECCNLMTPTCVVTDVGTIMSKNLQKIRSHTKLSSHTYLYWTWIHDVYMLLMTIILFKKLLYICY